MSPTGSVGSILSGDIPLSVVITDVNMAKVYTLMAKKSRERGQQAEADHINTQSRGSEVKFGRALNVLLNVPTGADGHFTPYSPADLQFHGRNGMMVSNLSPQQHRLLHRALKYDMWFVSRREAGQIYAAALSLPSLAQEDKSRLQIEARPSLAGGQGRFARRGVATTTAAFDLQTGNKILVAMNAVLRAAGKPEISETEIHFRGNNGYILTISQFNERRLALVEKIGDALVDQEGLKQPHEVNMFPPQDPPCTNETCIICCDGSITSAINPAGCRHAFACDTCLDKLPRCAMCQAVKTGKAPFHQLVPPISRDHPVYHAALGDVTF